jgi:hypothetical protein
MKKLSTLALVAILAVPASGVAYGLDATVKAGAAGAASTMGTETSVDATATGSVQSNYGTLISTLNAGKGTVDLSGVSADANVTFVKLSSLKVEGEANALDNALKKNAGAQTTLHASINANAALKAKLDAEKIAVDSVVAVTTIADGMLTVYVDDRA